MNSNRDRRTTNDKLPTTNSAYDATLRWLLTLPDFERSGAFSARSDAAPMLALLAELGDPHLGRGRIHIAGSKGKGSTGAMIEAVLVAAGLHTGYYISPHLHRYTERIRIDGRPIERDEFAAAMTSVRAAIERVEPRFPGREFIAFDALTAAAFVAFRDHDVDVQIIEVGLGGTLDSTNVFHGFPVVDRPSSEGAASSIDPRESPITNRQPPTSICVLTPISLEHTAILGDTIAAIAAQKAGIITAGAMVIAAPQREAALDAFHAVADERGATMIEVAKVCQLSRTSATLDEQQFKLKTPRGLYAATLPLIGRHQLDNAATAIIASEEFAAQADIELTPAHVSAGLAKVAWPARLEVLRRSSVASHRPLVIIDGAHNGDSAMRMTAALREHASLSHAVFLFGTLAGKDVAAMADAIAPMADQVFVTSWRSARAADSRVVADAFRAHDLLVSVSGDLEQAYESAAAAAGERGAVVAFGSIGFVAALREYLLGIESDMIMLALAPLNAPSGGAPGAS